MTHAFPTSGATTCDRYKPSKYPVDSLPHATFGLAIRPAAGFPQTCVALLSMRSMFGVRITIPGDLSSKPVRWKMCTTNSILGLYKDDNIEWNNNLPLSL